MAKLLSVIKEETLYELFYLGCSLFKPANQRAGKRFETSKYKGQTTIFGLTFYVKETMVLKFKPSRKELSPIKIQRF